LIGEILLSLYGDSQLPADGFKDPLWLLIGITQKVEKIAARQATYADRFDIHNSNGCGPRQDTLNQPEDTPLSQEFQVPQFVLVLAGYSEHVSYLQGSGKEFRKSLHVAMSAYVRGTSEADADGSVHV
jgi:hypothetical protein